MISIDGVVLKPVAAGAARPCVALGGSVPWNRPCASAVNGPYGPRTSPAGVRSWSLTVAGTAISFGVVSTETCSISYTSPLTGMLSPGRWLLPAGATRAPRAFRMIPVSPKLPVWFGSGPDAVGDRPR